MYEDCTELLRLDNALKQNLGWRTLAQTQDSIHSVESGTALQVSDLHGATAVLVPNVGYTMFSPEPLDRAH